MKLILIFFHFLQFFFPQIFNIWIVKLLLGWIISSTSYNAVDASNRAIQSGLDSNAEFIRYDMISPLTHMEIMNEYEPRIRRAPKSGFERGYEDFLRNYHGSKIRDSPKSEKYKVHESNQDDSERSFRSDEDEEEEDGDGDEEEDDGDRGDDDDDDNDDSDEESGEHRKRYKPKSQKKHKKHDKKKSKNCKTVKRGNKVCSICKNSKNDGKLESCKVSENPKSANYEVDSSYKNRDPESIEVDQKPPGGQRPPPYGRPYGPKYYPPPPHRPYNARPQVYARPVRPVYRVSRPPPDVAVLRLRTPESYQRVRLVPISSRLEVRPPRDIHTSASEPAISNHTKDFLFALPPIAPLPPISALPPLPPIPPLPTLVPILRQPNTSPLPPIAPLIPVLRQPPHTSPRSSPIPPISRPSLTPDGKPFAVFVRNDGAKCIKFFELSDLCTECFLKGERKKECISSKINKPETSFKSYSTSTKIHIDQPYKFEKPIPLVSEHSKHSFESDSQHFNDRQPVFNGRSLAHGNINTANIGYQNAPPLPPPPQSIQPFLPTKLPHQSSNIGDIIYGKIKPGSEPGAIFYHSGETHGNVVRHDEPTKSPNKITHPNIDEKNSSKNSPAISAKENLENSSKNSFGINVESTFNPQIATTNKNRNTSDAN